MNLRSLILGNSGRRIPVLALGLYICPDCGGHKQKQDEWGLFIDDKSMFQNVVVKFESQIHN